MQVDMPSLLSLHLPIFTLKLHFFLFRNTKDVMSDLKAQIAANRQGIRLLHDLVNEFSLQVIHAYMAYIQENAEVCEWKLKFSTYTPILIQSSCVAYVYR